MDTVYVLICISFSSKRSHYLFFSCSLLVYFHSNLCLSSFHRFRWLGFQHQKHVFFMSFLVLVLSHSDLPTNFNQCQCLRNYRDPAKFHYLFLTQNPSIPKTHGIFLCSFSAFSAFIKLETPSSFL